FPVPAAFQLINWREPKRSAAAFGLSLLVLISVATLSVISVLSYLVLACLCVTITFRIYKSVIQAIQKSDEGHPFRSLLEKDISISSEAVRELGDQCLLHLNCFTSRTRRLLLVEDLVDSLKLATVMWVMTYVGGMFNGITILILGEDYMKSSSPFVHICHGRDNTSMKGWGNRIAQGFIDKYNCVSSYVNLTIQRRDPGAEQQCKTLL
uniref:Reticulon n=1 Tax=Oryzias latipes TaxID=8090 RepID=A0A3B3HQT9_ORYLA